MRGKLKSEPIHASALGKHKIPHISSVTPLNSIFSLFKFSPKSLSDGLSHSSTFPPEYIRTKPSEKKLRREYIGRRGISLSGSYQQGYSTTYNTRSHIKVVCNGYILTHILN